MKEPSGPIVALNDPGLPEVLEHWTVTNCPGVKFVSKTPTYAQAAPEAQPVVVGPFETDTAAAPGTTGRVVVVVTLVVVVVTAALVVVVAATTVVVVTPALVVDVAAGSAGESLEARVVVVELPRRVVDVVEVEVALVTSSVPDVPETLGVEGFEAD